MSNEDEDRPDEAKRLKKARIDRKFPNAKAAATFFGWKYDTYSQHERGERGLTKAAAAKYAKGFRVSAAWLLTGENLKGGVPIVGFAGAGPEGTVVFSEADGGDLGDAPLPPGATDRTVAVEVRGTSMRGIADDGWYVYYDDRRSPPTPDLLGMPCVVELEDGRVMVKWLRRGTRKGLYTLESVSAPLLEDVRVNWAARVTFIMPRTPGQRAA